MTVLEAERETARSGAKAQRTAVGVLLTRFPTVTETFILREVIELERQGQPVRLVPLIRDNPPVIHEEAKAWTARALFTPWISGSIIAANVRMLVRKPARYLGLVARLFAGTLLSPGLLVRTAAIFPKAVLIAEQLEREGLRHIHAHYALHPSTLALIVARLTPITFSFTVHAHDIQLERRLLRWKLREARFVRSISAFNKRFLEGLYPAESAGKIHVVHVGIEPHLYERNAAMTPAAGAVPKILCVAGHKPYKGLPYLIEACRILRDAGVRFHCDVIGHGPMHDELEAMVRARKLDDVFTLVGPRPQDEVSRMMGEATLFVLPSIIAPDGQMEGIPVALMEAMASGRAVVSTAISGIPELIDDGRNGLLVPPADATALANAMRSLLEDPARARGMGEKGQEKVRREFTLRTCVTELLSLLDRENGSGGAS